MNLFIKTEFITIICDFIIMIVLSSMGIDKAISGDISYLAALIINVLVYLYFKQINITKIIKPLIITSLILCIINALVMHVGIDILHLHYLLVKFIARLFIILLKMLEKQWFINCEK